MFPEYQCPRCKKFFDDLTASRHSMVCPDCGVLVEIAQGSQMFATQQSEPRGSWLYPRTSYSTAELIIPSSNTVDIQSVSQFFSSLPAPLTLEFLSEPESIRMLLRGPDYALNYLAGSVPSIWPRAKIQLLPPEEAGLPPESRNAQAIWYTLSRADYLPLRLVRSFSDGDSMNLLLGSFRGLQKGQGVWLQLYLQENGKPRWLDDIRRRLKMEMQRGAIVEPVNPSGFPTLMPSSSSSGTVGSRNLIYLFSLLFSIPGLIGIALGGWYLVAGIALLIVVAALSGGLLRYLIGMSSDWMQTDLQQVSDKVSQSTFFSSTLRLAVWAGNGDQASAILHRVNHALRQFGSEQGNVLVPHTKKSAHIDPLWPGDLPDEERPSFWLGATELSLLWHPPMILKDGTAPSFMITSQVEKRSPPRRDVSGLSKIGTSISDDGVPVSIDITLPALKGGIFMVGKSRMGKSTLMELILKGALSLPRSQRPAVVFVDPHGDSAKRIPGTISESCIEDLLYFDVLDSQYIIGTNPLDVNIPGNTVDRAVQVVINTGMGIWGKFWGPRMFVPLENTLRALAAANVHRGKNDQLGLSCIVPFLMSPPSFRKSFLENELKANGSAYYSELARYFYLEYEALLAHLRQEIIQPVISKGNRFARSPALYLFSHPRNMLSVQTLLRERQILVISTRLLKIGADLGGFYSSFLMNFISNEMGLQSDLEQEERIPLLLEADECQTIEGYNWILHMSQLTKLGFWNVLGAQNFATLRRSREETNNDFAEILLGGVQSLAAFQCDGADAHKLSVEELSAGKGGPDGDTLINLDPHHCWFKTLSPSGHRLHPFDMKVSPPPPEDIIQREKVLEMRSRYCVTVEEAKAESERVLNEFLVNHGGPTMLSTGATGIVMETAAEFTSSGTRKPRKTKPDDVDELASRGLLFDEPAIKTGPDSLEEPSWNQLPSQKGAPSFGDTGELLSALVEAAGGDEDKPADD